MHITMWVGYGRCRRNMYLGLRSMEIMSSAKVAVLFADAATSRGSMRGR